MRGISSNPRLARDEGQWPLRKPLVNPSRLVAGDPSQSSAAGDAAVPARTLSVRSHWIFQLCVPVTSPLRCEIQNVPDRTHQIYAALLDLRRHPWMRRVAMVNGAVAIPCEDRNRGILMALPVFASRIVFERAIAGA